jgi:MFS superfamily sulfate permease-like transporter
MTVVCLVAYAAFGPSPYLVLGPDSSLGPMIAAAILPLAGMLALLVGLINLAAGVGKLGFVADLLSKPVRVGYLAGLSITIFIGQLPKLFGFSTDVDNFIEEITAFLSSLNQTNIWALAVGLMCVVIIFGLKKW